MSGEFNESVIAEFRANGGRVDGDLAQVEAELHGPLAVAQYARQSRGRGAPFLTLRIVEHAPA